MVVVVSHAREYAPGALMMTTRRTNQGEFLLRPDPEVVQAELYLLGFCQERYGVGIHAFGDVMNHGHLFSTDHRGDSHGMFMQEFYGMKARFVNSFRGRFENLWSSAKPNVVAVAPRAQDVVDKMAYIGTNVIQAGLVDRAHKWPGVLVVASSATEKTYKIRRPKRFFSNTGVMPEEVTLTITLPKVWDATPEELAEMIKAELERRAKEIRLSFREQGRKFMGAKKVLRTSPTAKPKKELSHFELAPTVACKDSSLRQKYLKRLKERRKKYAAIRALFLQGSKDLLFPEGSLAAHFMYGQKREPWRGCLWARLLAEPG